MVTCTCPAATSLPDIPKYQCTQNFGQIQKIAFQRLLDTYSGDENAFNADASGTPKEQIKSLAIWQSKMTDDEDQKIVISPYVQAPTNEPGSARTFGGGNETLGGMEIVIGREPSTFSASIYGAPQNVIAALKDLQCEAQAGNLGVYLFNEDGHIACLFRQDADGDNKRHMPIPIKSLFVSDKAFGGLEAPDTNTISWSFAPNWSDKLVIVKPNFNPLTEL